ncbi:HD-GYP domain-containing protein [Paenibacillus sp. S150]|uniref:HD-GYP domain-containing protein n=1 Tax=Paenibacillus sp. S150 TaxID=2749826 RepID=UPI001C59A1A4|nr:HD domain-containing phosphohydrolase [Paenibacillus sp. S150]MBW4084594.1 HD domain-containing protein [Paenibacillus sp. S150]
MAVKEYEEFIGKRLLANIYQANGTLLISQGTVLLESHIEKLANFQIKTGAIQAVEAEPSESPLYSNDNAIQTEKSLSEINTYIQTSGVVPIADIEDKVLPFIRKTAQRYNLFQVFSELQHQGDFRYEQSLGAAVIATSLGERLQLEQEELALLTTAATLYDIGTVKLPSSLIQKPGKLDTQEFKLLKKHTVYGYELLKNSDIDHRVALVALQHHEREDGSGYPRGLKGGQLDRLSKIVALADVYMALISDRPHRPAFTFFETVEEIHRQIILHRFDPVIGLTFLDMMLSRQVGCDVILSDDRKGKILLTNVNHPTKPLIVLDNREFLDLRTAGAVIIKKVIG